MGGELAELSGENMRSTDDVASDDWTEEDGEGLERSTEEGVSDNGDVVPQVGIDTLEQSLRNFLPLASEPLPSERSILVHHENSMGDSLNTIQQLLVGINQSLAANHKVVQELVEKIGDKLATLETSVQHVLQQTEKRSEQSETCIERVLQQAENRIQPTEGFGQHLPNMLSKTKWYDLTFHDGCVETPAPPVAGSSADTPGGDCRWHGRAEAVSEWTKQDNDQQMNSEHVGEAKQFANSIWDWNDRCKEKDDSFMKALKKVITRVIAEGKAKGRWRSSKHERRVEVVCVNCGQGLSIDYSGEAEDWPASRQSLVDFLRLQDHDFPPQEWQ